MEIKEVARKEDKLLFRHLYKTSSPVGLFVSRETVEKPPITKIGGTNKLK